MTTNYTQMSFADIVQKLFNSLPVELKEHSSIHKFKNTETIYFKKKTYMTN